MASTSIIELIPKILLALIILFVFIGEFSSTNLSDLWEIVPFSGKDAYIRVKVDSILYQVIHT